MVVSSVGEVDHLESNKKLMVVSIVGEVDH
jgi:hypothetical protein